MLYHVSAVLPMTFLLAVIMRPASVIYLERRDDYRTKHNMPTMRVVSGGAWIMLASPLHVFQTWDGVSLDVRHELERFNGVYFDTTVT